MKPPTTDRAQSAAIGMGLATLLFIGILYTVANQFAQPLEQAALDHSVNASMTQGIQYTGQVWDGYLFVALGVVTLGTIAAAVYQSRGGRR